MHRYLRILIGAVLNTVSANALGCLTPIFVEDPTSTVQIEPLSGGFFELSFPASIKGVPFLEAVVFYWPEGSDGQDHTPLKYEREGQRLKATAFAPPRIGGRTVLEVTWNSGEVGLCEIIAMIDLHNPNDSLLEGPN